MAEAIVVFGASGFVGRNLIERFAGKTGRIVAISTAGGAVPGADEAVRFDALDQIRPLPRDTVVVHVAAARYDAARFEMAQSDLISVNTEIANRVYRFCLERKVTEVRMASSVAVYPAGLPALDDAVPVDLNAPPNPNEAFYAWSKRWAEIVAGLFAERFGINTLGFRLSNPYGPYDATDAKLAHVLPAFVIRALQPGDTFQIKGNPLVERDFIFVEDVADVFEQSLAMRGVNQHLNLCSGTTTTLLDLARTILHVAGRDRPIDAPDTATQGVLARRSTNELLKQSFGKSHFASLEEGLAPTIEWYRHALGF